MSRGPGHPCLSEKGPMPKLVTVRVSESQREKLFERAKANGFRQLSDFIRSRLEIDLDND